MRLNIFSARRLTFVLFVVALSTTLFALVACAAPTAAPTATPPPATSAPAATTAPTVSTTPTESEAGINDQLIAAAKREGSVVLYGTSSEAALKADADGFQKQYGIPVNYIRVVAGPLAQRVNTELKAGGIQADVIFTADTASLDNWAKTGALDKLPSVNYPKKNDYYAPIQVIGQGLLYNTDEVSSQDLPKTWADVLNSKWTGRIGLGSPRIGPGYVTLYYALLQDPKYGKAFFEKLAAQKPRIIESDVLLAQSVAADEVAMGFTGFAYLAANIKNDSPSAPIDFAYLDIATVLPTNISLVAHAVHPNAAKLFVLWMMSPDGQTAHNGSGRSSSPLGNLTGTLPLAPEGQRVEIPNTTVSAQQQSIIDMFDQLFK